MSGNTKAPVQFFFSRGLASPSLSGVVMLPARITKIVLENDGIGSNKSINQSNQPFDDAQHN